MLKNHDTRVEDIRSCSLTCWQGSHQSALKYSIRWAGRRPRRTRCSSMTPSTITSSKAPALALGWAGRSRNKGEQQDRSQQDRPRLGTHEQGEAFVQGVSSPYTMEPPWWRRPSTLPLVLAVMALLIVVVGGSIRINDAGGHARNGPRLAPGIRGLRRRPSGVLGGQSGPNRLRGEDHRYTVFQILLSGSMNARWGHRLAHRLQRAGDRKWRDRYGSTVERAAQFSAVLLVIQATAGYVWCA